MQLTPNILGPVDFSLIYWGKELHTIEHITCYIRVCVFIFWQKAQIQVPITVAPLFRPSLPVYLSRHLRIRLLNGAAAGWKKQDDKKQPKAGEGHLTSWRPAFKHLLIDISGNLQLLSIWCLSTFRFLLHWDMISVGKAMEKVSLLPPGRLGWWKGLSVEKNCQLAKREGLGNANLIPIERAMSRGVTQGRVEENWSSRMMLKCGCVCIHPIRKLAPLTYCPNALSFPGYDLVKKQRRHWTSANALWECSGTPLLLKQTARQQRNDKKDVNYNKSTFSLSHKM